MSDDPIRVIVADDHALFRQGLAQLMAGQPGIKLLAQVESGEAAVEQAKAIDPDVVLLDVHMPGMGGVAAVEALKQATDPYVIMLTVSNKDEDLLAALEAGADGYLLKNVEPADLFAAIQQVAAGHAVLSPDITGRVIKAAARGHIGESVELSPRQLEVLQLLSQGATTAQIASKLVISVNTVKTHIRNILVRLEAANRAEAVGRAASLGLLDPPPSDDS